MYFYAIFPGMKFFLNISFVLLCKLCLQAYIENSIIFYIIIIIIIYIYLRIIMKRRKNLMMEIIDYNNIIFFEHSYCEWILIKIQNY